MKGLSVGVDVGGTFTDLAAVADDGSVTAFKVSSTPSDQSEGVEDALRRLPADGPAVASIVHGTTVVTNMLLERTGARVVLCATAGAADLLELRRQERAGLYDLSAQHPAALVPSDRVVAVDERIAPEGVVRPLRRQAAEDAAARVVALRPEVVAVSLLHSYSNPEHERQLAVAIRSALAERAPQVDVVCSCDVLPEIREYERTATAACEAYVRPGVGRYVARLASRLEAAGLPAPSVMSSSGGTAPAADAARNGASLALSGPAGGVTGAAHIARALGMDKALTIDIGGTSADVGLVLGGEPLLEAGGSVAGVPIALSRVLVETVSAGGGSIAWIDDGGALRVGPRSAGARPGPVAFRRGGTQPTVTDAHIALGNIAATAMSDGVDLDVAGSLAAIDALAARIGASRQATAEAIVAIVDASMARALRRVSVERGIDPRLCALIAFGGGGPLHACGLADRIGVRTVIVPPYAGVLSALGLAIASQRYVAAASVMRTLTTLEPNDLPLAALETTLRVTGRKHQGEGTIKYFARVRYVGQGHELDVEIAPALGAESIRERFVARHAERFGFTLERDVEIVSVRCMLTTGGHEVRLARRGASAWRDDNRVDDGGELSGLVAGRATVELPDATLLIANGWTATSLDIGGWRLERAQ
ncbi:MAG TPA: hydantoinase/oxoprolinase family protein [Gemmatimonadaceae bacterium]|nr:hydantoinase/oxoprolinase family protein [Gemmatimonadaceae bacterium]